MTKTSRIVQGIFAVIFGAAILSTIARGFIKYDPLSIILCIITGALFTGACIWFYNFLKKKTLGLTRRRIDHIFFCIAAAVLVLQVVSALLLKFQPVSDLKFVDTAARDFCQTWNKADLYKHLPERHMNYFARYTNNQAILIILSLVYSLCDKIFGSMPLLAPILINTVGLHISYVLIYFISKKIFKDKCTPLFCAIIGAGFSVFYTYTAYFYTDSMSMPFVMGAIYLFLCGIDGKMSWKKAIQLVCCGLLIAIGIKIKGSVVILIPAFLLYLIVTLSKENKLAYLKTVCILLCGVTVFTMTTSAFFNSFDTASQEELDEIKFPPHHWIMMGLHDRGGFYINDFWYTIKSGDYQQKKDADMRMIKKRISDYGALGMIKHLAKKISWTWGDGTYFIGYYLGLRTKHGDTNAAKDFIVHDLRFKFICTVYQCMLMFMILHSFISGALSKEQTKAILFKIIICGVFFFFAIWETRSRYLVNFTPVFIITAAYSMRSIACAVRKTSSHKKINVENSLKNVV